MDELLMRMWEDFTERLDGPMKFRFLLQPTMAAFLAIRAGLKDAHEGQPAYFWAIFTDPSQRGELLREGWKAVSKVFIVAVVMDVITSTLCFAGFIPERR